MIKHWLIGLLSGNQRSILVKKNIIASLVLKGCSVLVSLLLVPLTLGFVSSDMYGIWLAVSSILLWLSFFDVGFALGLKNRLAEAIAKEDWDRGKCLVSTTYFMMVIVFVPLCFLGELLIPHIEWIKLLNISSDYEHEIENVLQVLLALFCMQMIASVISSVASAFQQVALASLFPVAANFLSLIAITIVSNCLEPSLLILALSLSTMPVLVLIIASMMLYSSTYKRVKPAFSRIRKDYIGELFSLGYKFFIIQVQAVVLYQTTNVLIMNVSSPLDVTAYNLAYQYMNVAMMVFTIVLGPLWPAFTDAYSKGDLVWMQNVVDKMKKFFLISVVACVLLVLFSGLFYSVWIGTRAEIPLMLTIFVALYVIVYCWMNLYGTPIVGIGAVKLESRLVVVGMLVHIPLSLFLGKYFGVYGVISSMIMINLLYAIVFRLQLSKILSGQAKGVWIE